MALVVRIGISVALLATVARPNVGQAQPSLASRAERQILEARAARAESAATSGSLADDTKTARLAEASVLRARLRDGDFHPGDRIQVTVVGESALSNTYPVRTGCVIEIPTLPAISLHGVLRSELKDVLTKEVARYIRNPEVLVGTFMQVEVAGGVSSPGFYSVAPDAPLTEVLMKAGGPGTSADFKKSTITRGKQVVADRNRFAQALSANETLDDLGVQTGDQIVVGKRPQRWDAVTKVTAVLGLALSAALVARSR
jgi:polysaccharide export outer membrane protein